MSQVGFHLRRLFMMSSSTSISGGSSSSTSHNSKSVMSGSNSFKKQFLKFTSASYLIGFVFLSFCTSEGLTSPNSPFNSNEIQMKIRNFLESHCSKQNQILEQKEFEDFISCNPAHAATTFKNLDAYRDLEENTRHAEVQKEVVKQCAMWPQEKSCQRKNFQLIQKCFDGQQKFVFYFMLALTDTICLDNGDVFIDFWENGGDKCLRESLPRLTKDTSDCFSLTSTMTREELDRNIGKITTCIGSKLQHCENSNRVIPHLLEDIELFYSETSSSANSLLLLSTTKSNRLSILISLSLFIFITQRVLLS